MIKKICLLTFVGLFISSTAMAFPDDDTSALSLKESCQAWAKEDGIEEEDMKDFLEQCMADVQGTESQSEELIDVQQLEEGFFEETGKDYLLSPSLMAPKTKF